MIQHGWKSGTLALEIFRNRAKENGAGGGGLGSCQKAAEKRCPKAIFSQNDSLAWILWDMGHSYQNLPAWMFKTPIPRPCPRSNMLGSLEVDLGINIFLKLPGGL